MELTIDNITKKEGFKLIVNILDKEIIPTLSERSRHGLRLHWEHDILEQISLANIRELEYSRDTRGIKLLVSKFYERFAGFVNQVKAWDRAERYQEFLTKLEYELKTGSKKLKSSKTEGDIDWLEEMQFVKEFVHFYSFAF